MSPKLGEAALDFDSRFGGIKATVYEDCMLIFNLTLVSCVLESFVIVDLCLCLIMRVHVLLRGKICLYSNLIRIYST